MVQWQCSRVLIFVHVNENRFPLFLQFVFLYMYNTRIPVICKRLHLKVIFIDEIGQSSLHAIPPTWQFPTFTFCLVAAVDLLAECSHWACFNNFRLPF